MNKNKRIQKPISNCQTKPSVVMGHYRNHYIPFLEHFVQMVLTAYDTEKQSIGAQLPAPLPLGRKAFMVQFVQHWYHSCSYSCVLLWLHIFQWGKGLGISFPMANGWLVCIINTVWRFWVALNTLTFTCKCYSETGMLSNIKIYLDNSQILFTLMLSKPT